MWVTLLVLAALASTINFAALALHVWQGSLRLSFVMTVVLWCMAFITYLCDEADLFT